jgi:ubiquinone/menaquinone biosynthesis C-methylase UbiE
LRTGERAGVRPLRPLRRRRPRATARAPLSYPFYAVRAPLEAWIAAQALELDARFGGRCRLLDVGCGALPYKAMFDGHVSEYVGLDFVENPLAQLRGSAEALPVEDASFDVVLCTQVLEHCDDPARVVSELRRVTRPGGRVLASTHGVQVYHPSPTDHWRWTHTGLELLFTRNADWSAFSIVPGGGTSACIGMLLNCYIDLLAKRLHVLPLSVPVIATVNRLAEALDAASPQLRSFEPGTLIANYHITADA